MNLRRARLTRRATAVRWIALLALALCFGIPEPTAAHGGRRVLRTTAGPYALEAVVSRASDVVDETIELTDPATGQPIAGAIVALTLEHHGEPPIGPYVAAPADGRYEAHYPPPPGDHWSVLIRVQGPAGDGEARHPYRDPTGGRLWSGRAATVLNVLVLLLIASIPFVLPRLGRAARKPRIEHGGDNPEPVA